MATGETTTGEMLATTNCCGRLSGRSCRLKRTVRCSAVLQRLQAEAFREAVIWLSKRNRVVYLNKFQVFVQNNPKRKEAN